MKTTRHLIPLLLIFVTAGMPALAQWAPVDPGTQAVDYFLAVHAVDEQRVFSCDEGGRIFRTLDGGATWDFYEVVFPLTAAYQDITFADASHGYAVGRILTGQFIIDRTTDGGVSWSRQLFGPFSNSILHDGFLEVDFPTPAVGYAGGYFGRLYRTSDGGASWQNFSPPTSKPLISLEFIDQNKGFVLAHDPYAAADTIVLYKTTDAGSSWTALSAPAGDGIWFFNEMEGYNYSGSSLFRTSDGGISWEELPAAPASIIDIWFTDPDTGYFIDENNIYQSRDGGQSWLLQGQNMSERLRGLHFSDAEHGWIVGGALSGPADVFKTDNGGGLAGQILLSAENICPGDTVSMSALHDGATDFIWFVEGQETGSGPAAIFVPMENGVYNIELHLSSGGLFLALSASFEIWSMDLAAYQPAFVTDSICRNETALFTFPPLSVNTNLAVRAGNTWLADNINVYQQENSWESPPLDTTTRFDFYIQDIYCGQRLFDSKTIYVAPAPDTSLVVEILQNPICEGESPAILIHSSESHVYYQLLAGGQSAGPPAWGNGEALTLYSAAQNMDTEFQIRASVSSSCSRLLDTTATVQVMQVEPSFALSSQNILVGTEILVENTSADTLTTDWQLGANIAVLNTEGGQPVSIVFTASGATSISLTGTTPAGCMETIQREVTVHDTTGLSPYWTMNHYLGSSPSDNYIAVERQGYSYVSFQRVATAMTVNSRVGQGFTVDDIQIAAFAKFDSLGVMQWHNEFYLPEFVSGIGFRAPQMCTNASGEVYVLFSATNPGNAVLTSTDGRHYNPPFGSSLLVAKYSASGVLKWTEEFTCPGGSISGLSLRSDRNGFLYLLGNKGCENMQVKTPAGEFVYYQSDTTTFVARLSPGGHVEWITPFQDFYLGADIHFHPFVPLMIEPDHTGGVYLWSRGGPNFYLDHSYGVNLTHFDAQGAWDWAMDGQMYQEGDNNYIYANDLAVDSAGNALVLGTYFGPSYFGPQFGSYKGVFISKVGKDGQRRWTRSLYDHGWNINTTHKALAIAVEKDLVYVLANLCELGQVAAESTCFLSPSPNENLHLTVWDSLGNLLNVTSSSTSACFSLNPATPSRIMQLRNGILYVTADSKPGSDNLFLGYPLAFDPAFHNTFTARVPVPTDYYPYITLPEHLYSFCRIEMCTGWEGWDLDVSYRFEDPQWMLDGRPLPGANAHVITPNISGDYTVVALNGQGQTVETPYPAEAYLEWWPPLEIILEGNALMVQLIPGLTYFWLDSLGQVLASGVEMNTFQPEQQGYYQAQIDFGTDCHIRTDTFFYQTPTAVDDPDRSVSDLEIFPNPAAAAFHIRFTLTENTFMELELFNALGERINTIAAGPFASGRHTLTVEPEQYGLLSGVYWVVWRTPGKERRSKAFSIF